MAKIDTDNKIFYILDEELMQWREHPGMMAEFNYGELRGTFVIFNDKYEMPQGSARNMSGTGAACKTRRKYARDIFNYLKNNNAFNY